MRRIGYRDLKEAPQETLRACLAFLNEPYSADCLTPIEEKINSSDVPAGFDPRDERTDPALREEAHQLFEALDTQEPAPAGSAEASAELEARFLEQAHFIAWAEHEMTRRLEKDRLDVERRLEMERNSARRGFRLFRSRRSG